MRTQKITAILATLLLLIAPVSTAEPEQTVHQPEIQIDGYEIARNAIATLTISASGTAKCDGKIAALASTSSCSITTKLLRKSGSSWKLVKSWGGSGKGSATAGGSVTVSPGTYKVTVSGSVTAADGTRESVSKSSSQKTYA